jgi:hypothetical protein
MKDKEKYYENEILKLLKEYNENYGLLSEAKSKLSTLIKMGMAEGSAKILDDIFGPISPWMANKIGKYNLKVEPNTYSSLEKAISNIYLETEYYPTLLKTIKEYIEFELGGDKTSLNNVDFDDITNIAKDWKKNSGEFNYKEDEEYIILDFRKNGIGYYWIDLNTDNSNQECNRMGHCGKSSSGTLYSLRSYKPTPGKKYTINDSHLTAAIDDYGVLYQLKGKKNSKPKEEYHKYIIPLLEYKKPDDDYLINQFGNEYDSGNDFKLTDLSDNDFLKLYEVRPELYEYGGISVYKKLKEFGININLTLDTAYDMQFDYDRIYFLLKDDEEVYQEKVDGYWYRDQKRNVYMSEVVLKRDLDRFSDYVINNLIPMSWMEATSHISYENKNKIIELLKILAKKQNKEFILTDLNNAIEEYDNYEQISMAIDDAILRSTQEEAMDQFRDSLIEALEHYGYVDEYSDQISIEGDLTNLVDITNESVIEAFEWVENRFDEDSQIAENVFYRLLDKNLINLATWEYPTIELNESRFNFWLKEELDYNLKDSIKENYNDRKVINLLKQYNNKYGVLLEASKLKILLDKNKIGFIDSIAKLFDELCGSHSVFLANKLIKHYEQRFKNYNVEGNLTPKEIKDLAIGEINNLSISLLTNIISPIMDYLYVKLDGDNTSLKPHTWQEIYEKQKQWHDSLNIGDGAINYQETHPIIIDFRKDGEGYYWVDLETKNSDEECKRMGHCGRSSYGYLYSLRSDKKLPGGKFKLNRSHLTAAIGTDGIMYQLKGPKNSKPKEEYHQYITPLFSYEDDGDYLIQGFGSEYASNQDFKLTDLPDQTIKELYNNRPELFSSRSLQSKLAQMGIIEVKPFVTTFTIEFDSSDIGYYLGGDFLYRTYNFKTPAGNDAKRKVYYYETIMSDDVWDMYQGDGGNWKDNLEYYVDSDNEKKIEEMINSWTEKEGIEIDEDMSLKDKIEKYDDNYDIRSAINYSMSDIERDEYAQYLRNALETALNEMGNVFEFNSEKIKMQIDLKNLFSDNDIDDYFETYEDCNDDPKCLFGALLDEGSIDKPIPRFYDYWDADIDKELYNDRLTDRLNEI